MTTMGEYLTELNGIGETMKSTLSLDDVKNGGIRLREKITAVFKLYDSFVLLRSTIENLDEQPYTKAWYLNVHESLILECRILITRLVEYDIFVKTFDHRWITNPKIQSTVDDIKHLFNLLVSGKQE